MDNVLKEGEGDLTTTPIMRNDIAPRCDKHKWRRMTRAEIHRKKEGFESWTPSFACEEASCDRYFDLVRGYYSISGKDIIPESKNRHACPNDDLAMAIVEFEPQGSVHTWECAQFRCGRREQVQGNK